MAYNPEDAKKSYLVLLKEKGVISAFQSLLLVLVWYLVDRFALQIDTPPFLLGIGFLYFCVYFVWKPKLIRYLKEKAGQT